jgi:hypothetical protein
VSDLQAAVILAAAELGFLLVVGKLLWDIRSA